VARRPSVRKRDAHGWNTTDADEIEKRRERGRAEHFSIENLTPDRPVFSNFRVGSPSGQTYEVEVRDLAWREVFCTCVDFRVNRLGTCKHVEAVLDHLEKEQPDAFEEAIESGSETIDLVPSADGRTLTIARNLGQLPVRARKWFNETGEVLPEQADQALAAFRKQKLAALRISREVSEWEARREREADLFSARREYEQAVQNGRAPLSETAVPLAPYQREGMLHLAFRERAILADGVGLNRSSQAIGACALLERLDRVSRVLVIAPYSLRPSWEREIAQLTSLSYRTFPKASAARSAACREPAFFTLATYEQASEEVGLINETLAPDVVILDEAQRIRDWDSPIALRVKQLQSRYAFVLTSNEIGPDLDEVYALMSFVDPSVLGPLFRFNRDYYDFDEQGSPVGTRNLERLREKLRPFVLRRTHVAVATQIPSLSQAVYAVDFSSRQLKAYRKHEAVARGLQSEERKRSLTKPERATLMRNLGMMRMVSDALAVIGEQDSAEPPKLSEFRRILDELTGNPRAKVIVFTEWERMGRAIRRVCEDEGHASVFLHGDLTAAERRKEAARFAGEPECQIGISTDLGGSPLGIAGAQTLVHFDVPWNPRRIEERRKSLPASAGGLQQELFIITRGSVEERLLARHQRLRPEKRKRTPPKLTESGDLLPEPEADQAALPTLTPEQQQAVETALSQAAKRLRITKMMLEEQLEKDACEQLRIFFENIAIARATERGFDRPASAEALVEMPLAETLGAESLGLWKWFQQPIASAGVALAERLLAEQGCSPGSPG